MGGALYNDGTLFLTRSAFIANSNSSGNGGAVANQALDTDNAQIINTTFSGNSANSGNGGAIYNSNPQVNGTRQLSLINVTIGGNDAASGGSIYNADNAAILLTNTIVANGSNNNCAGPVQVTNVKNNLQFPGTTCPAATPIPSKDPKLNAPAPNLSPNPLILTMSLGPNSAASNAGDPATCADLTTVMSTDQRLFPRPLGDPNCDIGAYESNNAPGYGSNPAPGQPIVINTPVNVLGSSNVVIFETGQEDLIVNNYSLTGATAQLSINGPATPFTIVTGSGLTQTVTVSCVSPVPGQYTGTLTVTHNAAGSPATYPITCNVTQPGYASNPVPGSTLTINTTAGTPASQTVVISENGTANLTINSYAVSGATAQLSVAGTAAPFTIVDNSGATQTLTVTCNSAATGTFNGTLTVNHNAPGSPATYPIVCNVTAAPTPGYASNPAPGSAITINTTAGTPASATVVISENGTADLTISGYNQSGGPQLTVAGAATPFTIVDNSGATQTLTITCNSAVANTFNGTLTVNHNAPGSPATYPVTCNVTAAPTPGYASNPVPGSTLTINTAVGVPASKTVVISENGTADLTINSYAVTGATAQLNVTGTAAPFTIVDNSGATQTLVVNCNSAAPGTFNGTLTVNHNAPGSPATYPIVCNVTQPGYASNPAPGSTLTINTTVGTPASATVIISENGTADLTINSYAVSGAVAQLSVTGTAAPFTIVDNSGATQTLTVTCNSAVANTFNGTLTVNHNAPGSPATYPIVCNVTNAATPGYASNPIPGSTLTINTTINTPASKTVVISENGTANLTINSYNQSGGPQLTVVGAAAPFTIVDNSGTTQTLTVTCNSAAPGTFNGTLTVNHNAPGSPATYPVTCNVTTVATPGYASNPMPGSTLTINTIAGTPASASVVISENGTANLTVNSYAVTGAVAQLSVTGTAAAPFTIVDNSGATQTLTVTCNSPVPNTFNGTLTVTHNAPGSPATYPITCNVTAPNTPGYASNPAPGSTLTINTTAGTPATAKVVISENGTANLVVNSYNISGANLAVTGTAAPFTIVDNSGATQTLTVTCSSAAPGTFNGTLVVTHNAPGSPATYPVTCNVTSGPSKGPGYGSNPAPNSTINVGIGPVGAPVSSVLQVFETGTATLTVNSYSLSGPHAADFSITAPAFPFSIPDGGAAVNVTIRCIPTAPGLRFAKLTFNTNAGVENYNLQCGRKVGEELFPADLIPQLRVTPDRVVANDPENQITYSFKLKNIGQGTAGYVTIEFPVDPQLSLGYASFPNPKVWVSSVKADKLIITLPPLNTNDIVTGSLVFHPNREKPPVPGSPVFTRYTVHYDDPTGVGKKQGSNAVAFVFGEPGSNYDVSKGAIQLPSPSNTTVKAGAKFGIKTNFFIPNEQVSVWITQPDGKSVPLAGGRASDSGEFDFTPDTTKLAPGTYTVACYGNRSEVTGQTVLVVTA
jgi:hypothetical protein